MPTISTCVSAKFRTGVITTVGGKRDAVVRTATTGRPPAPSLGILGVAVDSAAIFTSRQLHYRSARCRRGDSHCGRGASLGDQRPPATSAQVLLSLGSRPRTPPGKPHTSPTLVTTASRNSLERGDHHRGGKWDVLFQRRQWTGQRRPMVDTICPKGVAGGFSLATFTSPTM